MKTVLFVVGSFRARSFNRQLAREAEALLAPRCRVEWLDFSSVPFMDQDVESPVPASVAAARAAVFGKPCKWPAGWQAKERRRAQSSENHHPKTCKTRLTLPRNVLKFRP